MIFQPLECKGEDHQQIAENSCFGCEERQEFGVYCGEIREIQRGFLCLFPSQLETLEKRVLRIFCLIVVHTRI